MKRNATLDSIVTRDIETVQKGQPLSEVAKLFRSRDFEHVPVLEGRRPVGMISRGDIMRLIYDSVGADSRAIDRLLDSQYDVEGVMSADLTTLALGSHVRDAARAMVDEDRHSIVVVDQEGSIAGIVTSSDLIRHLLALL